MFSLTNFNVLFLSPLLVAAFGFLDSLAKYHQGRARLVSKVVKYPNLEDYYRSVCEVDEGKVQKQLEIKIR